MHKVSFPLYVSASDLYPPFDHASLSQIESAARLKSTPGENSIRADGVNRSDEYAPSW